MFKFALGKDNFVITAYNPRTIVTELKSIYILQRIRQMLEISPITEEKFEEWLAQQPGGSQLLERLREGWDPPVNWKLEVNPLLAGAEARIVRMLLDQSNKEQGGCHAKY